MSNASYNRLLNLENYYYERLIASCDDLYLKLKHERVIVLLKKFDIQ